MTFASRILNWYQLNARVLPWRCIISPYRTWVSEVMLQQTQVETVIPYFERWMEKFPNIECLATADEQEILIEWEGLGYYGRALNLHRAAKQVMVDYHGELPQSSKELQKLPGIGPYTAAAIASIAFDENIAAIDANIRRVYARYGDVQVPVDCPEGRKLVNGLANKYLPIKRAGDFNQALMDLGSLICRPKNPKCELCPIASGCLAKQLGFQDQRPIKQPKRQIPHITVTAAVIKQDDLVLLAQRPPGGLLGGLWEFPGGTLEENDENLQASLEREINEELGVDILIETPFGSYNHAYTHYKITLHAFLCKLPQGEDPFPMEGQTINWAAISELPGFPMGKVDRQIAQLLIKEFRHGHIPS